MAIATKQQMWQFAPGTAIGAGRSVVRLLGGGDRYEAWLGWDDHLVAPVVIKLLRPSEVDSARSRAAIEREAHLLRSLAHPSVVRLFDADVVGARPYLVLEFLDGPRLSTLLRRFGPLSPEQLVALAAEMASALGYLHNERLLHLDVKPQNIIMGAPPRLIDLSICRRFDEVASLTAPIGTDSYMAPEQCAVERLGQIGPGTDVWGLGVTLFEAANGYRPYRPGKPGGPYPQLTDDPAPFHARVPGSVARVIGACLERDPHARPALGDLVGTLEELMPDARDAALRRLRRRVR